MTEAARHARNSAMLSEVYVTVRAKFAAVLTDLEGHHLRPRIQCAWRSAADQLAAYKSGHSQVKYGYHNATSKTGHPEALACDILDDDAPNEESEEFLRLLRSAAHAHNLDAPFGDWDPCHVQIVGLSIAKIKAGRRPV